MKKKIIAIVAAFAILTTGTVSALFVVNRQPLATAPGDPVYANRYEQVMAEDGYIYGIIIPWLSSTSYQKSFGTPPLWPGEPTGFNAETWRAALATTKNIGFNCVRICLFVIAEGLKFDQYGNCTGFDDVYMDNLRTVFEIAKEEGVTLNVTYFLHYSFVSNEGTPDMFGRYAYNLLSQCYMDPVKRPDFFNTILEPLTDLIAEYEDIVLCCDMYGEPEGDTSGVYGGAGVLPYGTRPENMQQFLKELKALIKSKMPNMPVTLSSGWMNYDTVMQNYYNDLDLDIVGVDIYVDDPYDSSKLKHVKEIKANAPVWLAEFGQANNEESGWSDDFHMYNIRGMYEESRKKGYIGGFLWMLGDFNTGNPLTMFDTEGNLRPATAMMHYMFLDNQYERRGLTVALDKPEILYGKDPYNIKWFGARNADQYRIERSTNKTSWTTVATVNDDEVNTRGDYLCSYEDRSVVGGVDYWYRIVAIGSGTTVTSEISRQPFRLKQLTCELADNFVKNGGFESDFTDYIYHDNGEPANRDKFSISTADKMSGSKSMKGTPTAGLTEEDWWSVGYPLTGLKTNTTYRCTYWVKSTQTLPGPPSGVCIAMPAFASKHVAINQFVNTNEWRMYTFDFNSGTNTDLIFMITDGGCMTYYIDDIYVFEVND